MFNLERLIMYKSKKWERKRNYILKRDGFICQEAKRYGLLEEATQVHHIYPVDEYPELAFENWNLVSLTQMNHNRMHDRNTREITSLGKRWQRRRRKEFNARQKNKTTST